MNTVRALYIDDLATCDRCGSFFFQDDFGLLVVDEAAQATEPETLCALTSAGRNTRVSLNTGRYVSSWIRESLLFFGALPAFM